MKIRNWYIGEEPPELTKANEDDAKLSRGDRKRKLRAQMDYQRRQMMASDFRNASGRLR
jgi:hypothetical protein